MATIKELKEQIQSVNALGRANLSNAGIDISETATTYDIMQNVGLPDWDDDSPIIASGYGINTAASWEITEKGTLRWKCNNVNATAGFDTVSISSILNYSNDFAKNAHKVKQVYVEDGFALVGVVALPNCERIRVPDGIKNVMVVMIGLKEIDLSKINQLRDYQCQNFYSLETAVLNPLWTILNLSAFVNCVALKTINLENIIDYKANCLSGTMSLEEITFNAGLVSIGANAFKESGIVKITFQTPTGEAPVISSSAFVLCYCVTEVNVYDGWNQSLYLQFCNKLTQESLHDMIEKFADMSMSDTTMIFNVGTKNIEKIDANHIAMLDAKCISYS